MIRNNNGYRSMSDDIDDDFIRNYYEQPVLQLIISQHPRARQERSYLADVACIALNQLPAKYIRHNVDMTFFLSSSEMQEIDNRIKQAVAMAVAYVESRENPATEES